MKQDHYLIKLNKNSTLPKKKKKRILSNKLQ